MRRTWRCHKSGGPNLIFYAKCRAGGKKLPLAGGPEAPAAGARHAGHGARRQ
jgi:hypothetical protein